MKTFDPAPFKRQLLLQREALLQQLDQQRGGASRVDAANMTLNHGEDSHSQVFSERELELILDDRESAELRTVNAALKRIADGVYGVCMDCGVGIPPARLHAAPEAERCVGCQEKHESWHGAQAGV